MLWCGLAVFCHASSGVVAFKDLLRELGPNIEILLNDKNQHEKIIDLFGSDLPLAKDKNQYEKALLEATGLNAKDFQKKFVKVYQTYYADLTLNQFALEMGMTAAEVREMCKTSRNFWLLSLLIHDKMSRDKFEDFSQKLEIK